MRSKVYGNEEYLRWEHISIKYVERDGVERLVALVNLQYCKGFK